MNIYRIKKFFKQHTPVICVRCNSIHFDKNIKYEWNTLGRQVALCQKCHKELFTPFSGGEK